MKEFRSIQYVLTDAALRSTKGSNLDQHTRKAHAELESVRRLVIAAQEHFDNYSKVSFLKLGKALVDIAGTVSE